MFRPILRQSIRSRRLLSSVHNPPPLKPKPSQASLPPQAPNATVQRKPKVDLRPAPIKDLASSSPSSSNSPPQASASTSSKPKTTSAATSKKLSSQPQHASEKATPLSEVTRAAQEDIKSAQEHGVLAPPPPDATWARRVLHQAIELFKFYYRGVKMINTHRLQVSALRKRVSDGGPPLTRAESRFISTFREDVKKLIPFLIIVLLLEEVIPLIALYVPSMLPSTCILPSQRVRIRTKKEEKARELADIYRNLFVAASPGTTVSSSILNRQGGPMAICALLRISTLGPDLLRTRRVKKHLKQVSKDDEFLSNEDMGARLTDEELMESLEERGITLGRLGVKEAKARLDWWLKSISSQTAELDDVALRLSLITKSLSLR